MRAFANNSSKTLESYYWNSDDHNLALLLLQTNQGITPAAWHIDWGSDVHVTVAPEALWVLLSKRTGQYQGRFAIGDVGVFGITVVSHTNGSEPDAWKDRAITFPNIVGVKLDANRIFVDAPKKTPQTQAAG